jgi:hypothetical protein
MRFCLVGLFLALELLTGIVLSGCSSVNQVELENSRAWIDKMVLVNLHYRRPPGAAADPKAGPGGVDYQSQPLPNSHIDCEPFEKLFRGLRLSEIRACLGSANLNAQDFILTYSVQKSIQPQLVLHKEEVKPNHPQRPECLDRLLSVIPVPREIYFQGVRTGHREELGCFAAGLPPDGSGVLGTRLASESTDLWVRVPPEKPLKSDQDVQLLLLSWSLRSFWKLDRNQMEARVVPDRLCRLCIGESQLVSSGPPAVPLWPTLEEADTLQSIRGSGAEVPVGTPNLSEQTGIN